ncbi:MAG: DUF58 domain-containing protein [Planctomycetaceae bacterium]|nr:DUF58 domain-containing protein [Planctomycetaceae bacterium]
MPPSRQPGNETAPAPDTGQRGGSINSKYLRMGDLYWLRNLFFSSRRAVEGQYAGRHASSARGHSVEFNDYRQYMPGDEIGDVDWKIYARSDKLFIKLFEHQSDMTVNLLVDASASMAYSGLNGGVSKYDHACQMAAAIAFLTTKQTDKVSFGVAQEGLKGFLPPYGSFGHFCNILRVMEEQRPAGQARLAEALKKTATLISRRGLLILFSDLLDDNEAILDALNIFSHRGSEVILFHVLHTDELTLPDLNEALFVDSESARRLPVNVGDLREAYRRRIDEFLETWSATSKRRGIDYKMVSTAVNYCDALEQYLFQRASMA